MGSVAERYCAKGARCTQYGRLGGPAMLRSTSESDICEACRSADLQTETSPTRRDKPQTRRYDVLETSVGKEIKSLKSDLVLQLYRREGRFWEAVRQVRERWDIEPDISFPPPSTHGGVQPASLTREPPPRSQSNEYTEWYDKHERWIKDLEFAARAAIPSSYIGEKFGRDWGSFVSICVCFQPVVSGECSAPKLREFAEIGGPEALSLPLKPGKQYPGGPLMAVKSPIRVMSDPAEEARIEARYRDDVVRHIWEHYIKHSGVSLDEVLAEVHREHPEIEEERAEGLSRNRNSQTYWIKFDENVRAKDLLEYARMIMESQNQETRPSQGAPRVNRLECVECTELYLRHGWTLEQLAQYYRVSQDTIKRHIRIGREVLGSS